MKIEVITGHIDDDLADTLAQIQQKAYVTSGMRSYKSDEIRDLLSHANYTLYLIYADAGDQRTIAGFLIEQFVVDEVEIITIAIKPAFQGQKLGKALFSGLFNRNREAQNISVFLEVAEINLSAIIFYKSVGFEISGTRKGYYSIKSSPVDALIMRK